VAQATMIAGSSPQESRGAMRAMIFRNAMM